MSDVVTEEQHSIIVGSLLGDGSMRCKRHALLEINHCLVQRPYVDWKWHALAGLVRTPPKMRKGNGSRLAYRFTTLSLPELTPFYRAFYANARKRVPQLDLTPLALAVWFMDDGSRSRNAVYLNTQQFAISDQELLVRALHQQFGLKATLNRDKHYFRIRIAVESMNCFGRIIGPHLLEAFQYKLPPSAQASIRKVPRK